MKRQLWDGAEVVCLSLILLGVFPRCSLQSVGDSLTSFPDLDVGQRRDGEVGDEIGFGDQVDGPSRQTRSTAGSKTHAQTEAAYQQYRAKMQSGNFPPADPDVLCGDNAINVKIGLEDSESLYAFASDGVPLSFSDLPPDCKTDVLRMPDALVLIAQYDGCFVQAQGSAYVLRLRWYGEPIEAVCPRGEDPLIICYQHSMQVLLYGEKLEETVSANVNGWWSPLGQVSAQCRFGLGRSPGMLSLSAAFHGCGMTQKNGLHTLHLQSEDRDMSLSCPSGPAADGPPAVKDPQPSPEPADQFPPEEKRYRSLPPKDPQPSPELADQFPLEEKQYRSLPSKDLEPSPELADQFPLEEKQYRSLPSKDLEPSPELADQFPLEQKQYRSLLPKDPQPSSEPANQFPLEEKQYRSLRLPQSLLEPISDETLPVPPFSEVPTYKPSVPAPPPPNIPAASQSLISSSVPQDGTTLPFPANQSPPQPPPMFVSNVLPTFMQVEAPTMPHQQQTPQHKLPQILAQSPQQITQAFAQSLQQQMPQAVAQSHQQAAQSVAQSPQQHSSQGFTHSLQQVLQGMVQSTQHTAHTLTPSHQQTPASAHSAQYVPQTENQSPQKLQHAFTQSSQQQVPPSVAQSPWHPSLQLVSQSISKHAGGSSQQPLVKPAVSEQDPQRTQVKGDAEEQKLVFDIPSFGPQTLTVPQNTLASQIPKQPPVEQTLFSVVSPKTPDIPAPQKPDAGKGQQPVSPPWKPGFPVEENIGSRVTKWFSQFKPGAGKPGSGQVAQVPGTGMIAQQATSTLGAQGVTGYSPSNEDQLPHPVNTQAAHTSPVVEQLYSRYTKWLSHFQQRSPHAAVSHEPSTAHSSAQALLPQHMAQTPQQVSQQPAYTKDTKQPQAKVPQVSQALQQVNSQSGNGMSMFLPSTLQAAASIQERLTSQISQQPTSIQATQHPQAQVPHVLQQQQTGQVQMFPYSLPSPSQTQTVPQEPSKGQFAQQSQVQVSQKPHSGLLLQHQTGQAHQRQEFGQTPEFHLSYSQTQTVPQYPPKGQLPQQSQSQVTQVHQEPSKVQVPQVPEQQQTGHVQAQQFPDFYSQTQTVPQYPPKGQLPQQSQSQVTQVHQEPSKVQVPQVPEQQQPGHVQAQQFPDFYSQTQTVPQYPPKGQLAQHSQIEIHQEPSKFHQPTKGQLTQPPKGFPDFQLNPSPIVTQAPAKTEVAKFPPFPGIHMEPFRVQYSHPSQNAKGVSQPQKIPEAVQVPKQPTPFYTPVAQSGSQAPPLPQFVSPVSVPQKQDFSENIKGSADSQPSPSPAQLGLLGSPFDQLMGPFAQQPQDQMPQSAVHVQQQAPEVNEGLWDTKWPSKFQQDKTEIPTAPQKHSLAIDWPIPTSNVGQKDVQQQKFPDVNLPVSSQSPTYIEYKYPKPLLHLLASSLLHGPTTHSVAKKPQFPAPATSGLSLPEAQSPSSASKGQQQQVLYTPSTQGQQQQQALYTPSTQGQQHQQVLYTSHGQTNLWN
ncbi:protein piccolo-like [Engraulis encrasicolus]|uniref:protein piccolo-like n=1 Tax=Engraulis encrasicolus TaxID=184585 RepID=UPI002FCFDDCD